MGIKWGSSEGNNVQKVGVETTMSPSTVTSSTTSVTLTIRYYTYQKYYSGDNQKLNKTGSYTGSKDYYMPATADYQLKIDTDTHTVSTSTSGTVTKSIGANISGHYGGATPSVSSSFTIPQRPVSVTDVPAAPTSIAVARVSDTSHTVTWANNPTSSAPYTNIYVERRDDVPTLTWAVRGDVTMTIASPCVVTMTNHGLSTGEPIKFTTTGALPTGITADVTYYAVNVTSSTFSVATTYENAIAGTKINTSGTQSGVHAVSTGWQWSVKATLGGTVASYSDTSTAANKKYQYRVRAWNGVGYSTSYATSGYVYTTPAAPTMCSAARNVTDVVVTWDNTSSHNDYYEVWESAGGAAYTLIATPARSAGYSYTHTAPSTAVTHSYKVRAKLTLMTPTLYGADSPVSNTVGISGPPNAPTGLLPSGVYVDAHNAILLDWNHNPVDGTAQTYREIWYRVSGGSDETWAPLTWSNSGTATMTIAAPAVVTKTGHGLTTGEPIKFTTTGALPTGITADTKYWAIVVSTSTFNVATTYANALAGTKITTTGSQSGTHSLWVGRGAGSVTTYEIAADTLTNGNDYDWKVRTWGQYSATSDVASSGSPWSPTAVFSTSSLPVAVIQSPTDNGTLNGSTLLVTWTYTDESLTAQTAYQVNIYDSADVLLKTVEYLGAATTYADNMILSDATVYKVGVRVSNGAELWSDEAINSFTVAYVPPVAPVVTADWDDVTGSVTLNITNPTPTTEPATVYNEVWRSINGETPVLMATGLALNTSMIDYLPAVGGTNVYSIIAYSAIPTVKTSTVTLDTGGYNTEGWVWLNAGPSFSSVARVNGAPKISFKYGREKVLHTFAGRRQPVEFAGETRYRSIELEANLRNDEHSRASDFEALTDLGGIVAYRDPSGRRIFCSMGDVAFGEPGRPSRISTTLTEVFYEEGSS